MVSWLENAHIIEYFYETGGCIYATIEADIDNGMIQTSEESSLPLRAHVLITLLSSPTNSLDANQKNAGGRVPHPDLKHSIEVCGDLLNTVPVAGFCLNWGANKLTREQMNER